MLSKEAQAHITILESPHNAQATDLDPPNSANVRPEQRQERLVISNESQHRMFAAEGILDAKAALTLSGLLCWFMLAGLGLLLRSCRTERVLVIVLMIPAPFWDVALGLVQEMVT